MPDALREWLDERILRTQDARQQVGRLGDAPLSPHPVDGVQSTGVSPNLAAELMYPVVQALVRSHEMGIVHRDLKPANIMLTDDGAVKVLDFGIAKVLDTTERTGGQVVSLPGAVESGLTRAGNLIGTLMYMSPEQWGARTDGAVLLWNADGSESPVVVGRHDKPVLGAVFSPDGRRIATASEDQTARIWNVDDTGEPVVFGRHEVLRGHDGWLYTAQFSLDGSRVVTASADATARIRWVVQNHDDVCRTKDFGQASFCTEDCPCVKYQGDCDNDLECADGTVCTFNIGADFGAGSSDGICM